ncbi:MAG: hypothetical protein M1818_003282 [Claussenomyces sp. TS43310]|nr:MAG: hypothetical protein M1818_003282 [Claussenomyces sp. TS43310]
MGNQDNHFDEPLFDPPQDIPSSPPLGLPSPAEEISHDSEHSRVQTSSPDTDDIINGHANNVLRDEIQQESVNSLIQAAQSAAVGSDPQPCPETKKKNVAAGTLRAEANPENMSSSGILSNGSFELDDLEIGASFQFAKAIRPDTSSYSRSVPGSSGPGSLRSQQTSTIRGTTKHGDVSHANTIIPTTGPVQQHDLIRHQNFQTPAITSLSTGSNGQSIAVAVSTSELPGCIRKDTSQRSSGSNDEQRFYQQHSELPKSVRAVAQFGDPTVSCSGQCSASFPEQPSRASQIKSPTKSKQQSTTAVHTQSLNPSLPSNASSFELGFTPVESNGIDKERRTHSDPLMTGSMACQTSINHHPVAEIPKKPLLASRPLAMDSGRSKAVETRSKVPGHARISGVPFAEPSGVNLSRKSNQLPIDTGRRANDISACLLYAINDAQHSAQPQASRSGLEQVSSTPGSVIEDEKGSDDDGDLERSQPERPGQFLSNICAAPHVSDLGQEQTERQFRKITTDDDQPRTGSSSDTTLVKKPVSRPFRADQVQLEPTIPSKSLPDAPNTKIVKSTRVNQNKNTRQSGLASKTVSRPIHTPSSRELLQMALFMSGSETDEHERTVEALRKKDDQIQALKISSNLLEAQVTEMRKEKEDEQEKILLLNDETRGYELHCNRLIQTQKDLNESSQHLKRKQNNIIQELKNALQAQTVESKRVTGEIQKGFVEKYRSTVIEARRRISDLEQTLEVRNAELKDMLSELQRKKFDEAALQKQFGDIPKLKLELKSVLEEHWKNITSQLHGHEGYIKDVLSAEDDNQKMMNECLSRINSLKDNEPRSFFVLEDLAKIVENLSTGVEKRVQESEKGTTSLFRTVNAVIEELRQRLGDFQVNQEAQRGLSKTISMLREDKLRLEEELNKEKDRAIEWKLNIVERDQELGTCRSRISDLTHELERAHHVPAEDPALRAQLDGLESFNSALQSQLEPIRSDLKNEKEVSVRNQKQLLQLTDQLDQAHSRTRAVEAEKQSIGTKIKEEFKRERIKIEKYWTRKVDDEKNYLDGQIGTLREVKLDLENELKQAQEEVKKNDDANKELESQNSELRARAEQLTICIDGFKSNISILEEGQADSRSQIQVLKDSLSMFDDYKNLVELKLAQQAQQRSTTDLNPVILNSMGETDYNILNADYSNRYHDTRLTLSPSNALAATKVGHRHELIFPVPGKEASRPSFRPEAVSALRDLSGKGLDEHSRASLESKGSTEQFRPIQGTGNSTGFDHDDDSALPHLQLANQEGHKHEPAHQMRNKIAKRNGSLLVPGRLSASAVLNEAAGLSTTIRPEEVQSKDVRSNQKHRRIDRPRNGQERESQGHVVRETSYEVATSPLTDVEGIVEEMDTLCQQELDSVLAQQRNSKGTPQAPALPNHRKKVIGVKEESVRRRSTLPRKSSMKATTTLSPVVTPQKEASLVPASSQVSFHERLQAGSVSSSQSRTIIRPKSGKQSQTTSQYRHVVSGNPFPKSGSHEGTGVMASHKKQTVTPIRNPTNDLPRVSPPAKAVPVRPISKRKMSTNIANSGPSEERPSKLQRPSVGLRRS